MNAQAEVVLVNISNMPGVTYLAGGSLIAWARRDGKLAGLTFRTVEVDSNCTSEMVADQITALAPRLVGFSCYIWNFRQVMETARLVKNRLPGTSVILGGSQVASVSEKILAEWPHVDYVAYGEGEETFRQLVGALFLQERPIAEVAGIAYRASGRIVKTPEPRQIDLRELPSPYLTGDIPMVGRRALSIVDDSRGCPFSCKYCDWGPKNMRYSPIERLEEEFRRLAPYSDYITLTGADLFMNKKWGIRVTEAFIRATPTARRGGDRKPSRGGQIFQL